MCKKLKKIVNYLKGERNMMTINDVKLSCRQRAELKKPNRKLRIGMVESYGNNEEIYSQIIQPYQLRTDTNNNSWLVHPRDTTKITCRLVSENIPFDYIEMMLVPSTSQGFKKLIEWKPDIVNMSLTGTYEDPLEKELAKTALLITATGNYGSKGESFGARKEWWLAVGALSHELNHLSYSGWGYDKVCTMGYSNLKWDWDGYLLPGTSFSAPFVTGLVAQYYLIVNSMTGQYPTWREARSFIKLHSHDVLEDGRDLKSGWGLFRLPQKITVEKVEIKPNSNIAKKYIYTEGEPTKVEEFEISLAPFFHENKTCVSTRDMANLLGVSVGYNSATKSSTYVKTVI